MFNNTPQADFQLPTITRNRDLLELLKREPYLHQSQTIRTIASILAGANSIGDLNSTDAKFQTFAEYTADWREKTNDGKGSYIGHSIGIEIDINPIATIGGRTISVGSQKTLRILEGTAPATKTETNPRCLFDLCENERRTQMREHVQNQI